MGQLKKIVLTGGPCGGKSTVQSMLSDVFANNNWKVFRVPETATVLLSGGVSFAEMSPEQAFQFQRDLLLTMLQMEQTYFNLARTEVEQRGRNALVICDRGAMDASAYIPRDEWLRLLQEVGKTEVQLRDERYDYVVHLVSAARGAAEFYDGPRSNHVRSEGVEAACALDVRCQQAWIGHPYMDIIDNESSLSFDDKCRRVVSCVLQRLGFPDRRFGKDIRKCKFLINPVKYNSIDAEEVWKSVPYSDFLVRHDFLANGSRVRQRTQDGVSHFNLTTPRSISDHGVRIVEMRRSLTGNEYDALLSQVDRERVGVVKQRRCFLWHNLYYQLDVFQEPVHLTAGSMGGQLVILEAYLPSGVAVGDLPAFLPIVKEVTHDKAYKLSNLALIRSAIDT